MFCFPIIAFPQNKIAVEVCHSGSDIVGRRLVYQIKEKIRRSGLLRLTTANEPRFRLSIITIDNAVEKEYSGYSSSYSLAWILCVKKDFLEKKFITHNLGICGGNRVNEVAEGIVAETDEMVSDFLKVIGGTYE